jgi:hypothetical protein
MRPCIHNENNISAAARSSSAACDERARESWTRGVGVRCECLCILCARKYRKCDYITRPFRADASLRVECGISQESARKFVAL